MANRELKQSTAANEMVFMASSSDHISGATGLTLAISASKDGGAFASITPTVTERGNGWYNLALTASHTDTPGDLAFHVTATGADPSDFKCEVVSGTSSDVLAAIDDAQDAGTVVGVATVGNVSVITASGTSIAPANMAGMALDSNAASTGALTCRALIGSAATSGGNVAITLTSLVSGVATGDSISIF